MVETSTAAAFRLLELVSLFLPIVLILLQITVRFYRNDELGSSRISQFGVFFALGVAAVMSIFAGVYAVQFLSQIGFEPLIITGLRSVQIALLLLSVPVLVLVSIAIENVSEDTQGENQGESEVSEQEQESNPDGENEQLASTESADE